MKYHETHFEEYIKVKNNLHPKLEKLFNRFPKHVSDLRNLIFYGPSGAGKYTQMLRLVARYSPSDLKYEKKISMTYNKLQYFFKISDIHYEVDMSLLGCNSKLLWHEIYLQVVDIISAKSDKSGILVCKYFNEVHNELLDNFYSYMQKNNALSIDIKFILLTEELSFIPDNVLNCCEVIHISRPTAASLRKCLNTNVPVRPELVTNIKNVKSNIVQLMAPHKIICDKVLDAMINIEETKFLKFRDLLYDIFIYNVDITDCVWYIISSLVKQKRIQGAQLPTLLGKTYTFFQYYNNNYRPIYHVEKYLFFVVSLIHKYKTEPHEAAIKA